MIITINTYTTRIIRKWGSVAVVCLIFWVFIFAFSVVAEWWHTSSPLYCVWGDSKCMQPKQRNGGGGYPFLPPYPLICLALALIHFGNFTWIGLKEFYGTFPFSFFFLCLICKKSRLRLSVSSLVLKYSKKLFVNHCTILLCSFSILLMSFWLHWSCITLQFSYLNDRLTSALKAYLCCNIVGWSFITISHRRPIS